MAGMTGINSTDSEVATSKLYKGGEAKLIHMEPGREKVAANPNKSNTASLIERFIEENSGEYDKKKLYSLFSDKINLKEFKSIIAGLRESGKIAIDRNGVIVWILYPELAKKYRDRADLSFR